MVLQWFHHCQHQCIFFYFYSNNPGANKHTLKQQIHSVSLPGKLGMEHVQYKYMQPANRQAVIEEFVKSSSHSHRFSLQITVAIQQMHELCGSFQHYANHMHTRKHTFACPQMQMQKKTSGRRRTNKRTCPFDLIRTIYSRLCIMAKCIDSSFQIIFDVELRHF